MLPHPRSTPARPTGSPLRIASVYRRPALEQIPETDAAVIWWKRIAEGLAARACVSNCVAGVGLFQEVEFILGSSPWELLKHAGVGLSRLRNCYRLLRRSRVCRVHLGRDPELNTNTVLDYCSTMVD